MKKFLSILTLLCLAVTGAWAADSTPTYAQPAGTLDVSSSNSSLATILSDKTWSSRNNNLTYAYEITNDYVVFSVQAIARSTGNFNFIVQENASGNTNDATWDASDPFKAHTYYYSSNKTTSVKLTSDTRMVAIKVTGCTDALVYAGGKGVTINAWLINDENNSAYNTYTKTKTATTTADNKVVTISGLDDTKTYVIQVVGSSGAAYTYGLALKRAVSNTQPTITTQPQSATYESGDTPTALTVAATASAGDLSYQWYSNTTASNEDGTAIDGETNASYSPSTATAGTYYYYCVVTDDNGSSASNAATITVVNAIAPVISYASASNTVTITCEGAGTIYYTTDNSEPTASSTPYTAPFVLTDAATVRAVAIKGGNASEIVFAKCKVDHSATALAVIGFGDGTHASGVWTSNDDNFTLTSSNASDIQYYTVFSGQDGFKINATNGYTLKVSDNIKVTSIKFVGISRADAANDATIALDGFTPASATIEKGTFVKTVEFTPTSELGYGATINITTGGNQFGGYFEIYGEEYTKSVTTTSYETTTWDFTNWSDATKDGMIADTDTWNQNEKTGDDTGLDFGNNGRSLAITRSNNSLSYGSTKIAETDGLKFSTNSKTYALGLMFNLPSATVSKTEYTYHGGSYIWLYNSNATINIENVTKGSIIEIGVESHNGGDARTISLSNATQTQGATSGDAAKVYQVCKWEVTTAGTVTITPSKGLHIYYIKLDKATETEAVTFTPAYDKTTYVTTKALDFSNVDGLKAYVATKAEAGSGSVTLSEVGAVPAETPLMLIGTAGTEYTIPVAASATAPETNLFLAGDGTTVFDGSTYDFILYSDGLFYQIGSGTVATTKAYLHCESDPRAAAQGARGLSIVFEDETTGIGATLMNSEKVNSEVYNLNGQRVAQPSKGLYIVNGRKVVIK